MTAPATAPKTGRFEAWCDCVRQLLGGTDGSAADWGELFAAGRTPRDAARRMVYGDCEGD